MSTATAAAAHSGGVGRKVPDVFDMSALKAEAAAVAGQGSSYSACQTPHFMLTEANMNSPAQADRDVDAVVGNGAVCAAGAGDGGGGGNDGRSSAAVRAAESRGVAVPGDEKENLNPVCLFPLPSPHPPGPRRLCILGLHTATPQSAPLRIHAIHKHISTGSLLVMHMS